MYELKNNINRYKLKVLKPFQYEYPNKEYVLMLHQEVFSFGRALTVDFL